MTTPLHAPTPDLRIISSSAPQPHEEHDNQRAIPLMEKLQQAAYFTNPPIVYQAEDESYIILDGANRCHSVKTLGIPHILVQVVSYFSPQVELKTWNHVVSRWHITPLMQYLRELPHVTLTEGLHKDAIAHVYLSNSEIYALSMPVANLHERNQALRDVVRLYQKNAVLSRTNLFEPNEVWHLYPEANALIVFPPYSPLDIIEAARQRAYLPPGISRHVVHGRALQVNYPIADLKNTQLSLEEKNARLKIWLTEKLMNREVRYYAESTYQFSE